MYMIYMYMTKIAAAISVLKITAAAFPRQSKSAHQNKHSPSFVSAEKDIS